MAQLPSAYGQTPRYCTGAWAYRCVRLSMIAGVNCLSNHFVRFCPLEAMCSVRGASLVSGMCADYVNGPVNRPLTDNNL
jgi:hypothetical protein